MQKNIQNRYFIGIAACLFIALITLLIEQNIESALYQITDKSIQSYSNSSDQNNQISDESIPLNATNAAIHTLRLLMVFISLVMFAAIMSFIYFFNAAESKLITSKDNLRESKLRLRLAFENIPTGNIVADWHGNIVEFSKGAETIFGYTSGEALGKNLNLLMSGHNHTHHHQYVKDFLETGEEKIIGSGGLNTSGLHKNGKQIPIHICIGTMVVDYQLFFIASITDLTVQTKINKQLFNSEKMKAVGQLSSGLAHDFNNLLGIAIGNLQLLKRKTTLDQQSSEKVESSLQALNRGAKITNQLLNFTRTGTTNKITTNINESISGIKSLIEQAASKKVNIVYSLADNLSLVDINLGEFGDVVINLTSNARDAMPDGGSLFIETNSANELAFSKSSNKSKKLRDYIQLTIRDTGVGIDPEKLERIFEPFYTTKERNKGTGLGLAMVDHFIKSSDGKIIVHSEIGLGCSFNLYFPVSKKVKTQTVTKVETSIIGGTETLLLVDDEIELLAIAEDNLQEAGYKVITASSAEQALDILNENESIALLITDIVMPTELNGFELAIKCMTNYPHIKVALMSGFTAKAGAKRVEGNLLANYLAKSLLQKPFSRKDILSFVRMHLDKQRLFDWINSYTNTIEAIDNDHRVLLEIVNSIYTEIQCSKKPVVQPLLIELNKYTNQHHRREEIIMKVCDIADVDKHSLIHREIENNLTEYCNSEKTFSTDFEKEELLNFLTAFVNSNIEIEAKAFKPTIENYSMAIQKALEEDAIASSQ